MKQQFTDQQMMLIVEESLMYMCACPAQVAQQVRQLRSLYRYQSECQALPDTDKAVHQAISQAAAEAHAIMEACMDKILTLEGWDRETLTMPAGLRKIRDDLIEND